MHGCANLLKVCHCGEGFWGVDSERLVVQGYVKHLKVCHQGEDLLGRQ